MRSYINPHKMRNMPLLPTGMRHHAPPVWLLGYGYGTVPYGTVLYRCCLMLLAGGRSQARRDGNCHVLVPVPYRS